MDFVEVGNVSTTSGFGSSGQNDEAALLLKSVVDNKISFQQGKTLRKCVKACAAMLGAPRAWTCATTPISTACCP
jgi:hypothetical protein